MIMTETYLGPATVLASNRTPSSIQIQLPSGETLQARLALSLPYEACEGDQVLVIAQESDQAYVIGVLKGNGPTTITVPADLRLRAPNGGIELESAKDLVLQSGKRVSIEGPDVDLRAGRLQIFSHRIIQKAREVYHWVSDLFQVKSGRARMRCDSTFHLKAHRTYLKGESEIALDGKKVYLG